VTNVVGEAVEIPITDAPPELRPLTLLPDTVNVAAFEEPRSSPVMEFPVVMLLIVFVFTFDPAALKLTDIGDTVPAPVVMLLKVFPLTVLVGAPPSVLRIPLKAEAPVSVILEKLLLLFVWVEPAADEALELQTVVVPTPVRVNPVTIELPVSDMDAPEIKDGAKEKNVTVPVVLTDILVNVLLLKVCVSGLPPWEMNVIAPVPPATV
jgi:hypothetical protein